MLFFTNKHYMLINKYFLSIILYLLISLLSYSQNIQIINYSTGLPVENVALFNSKMNKSTLSDEQGIANIESFNIDDTLIFQHPSYKTHNVVKREILNNKGIIQLEKRVILMDEFVISASKTLEKKNEIPYKIDLLKKDDIENSLAQNSSDLLTETGSILIQKSQGGGGSPNIRGFEANRILLVVDGVRMNNAIYRSGHIQNSVTIDNSILERIEIIYGPTSLIYGSDALGGVIHYITKDPVLSDSLKSDFKINSKFQYATANKGRTGHLDFNYGTKSFASLTSFTFNNFDDIKMGSFRNPSYGDLGLIPEYADRINGIDTVLQNPDPEVQKGTGYSQIDFMQKFRYSIDRNINLIASFQYSTSSNIDRIEKLNDYRDGTLKYANWYYGPQNRLLASLKAEFRRYNRFFTNATSILAFQRIDEDRISRNLFSQYENHQEEDVDVLTYTIDFLKILRDHNRLNYGIDYQYNNIESNAYDLNILNHESNYVRTRYPDGFNDVNSLAGYINYKHFYKKKLILSAGVRYNYSSSYSTFTSNYLHYINLPYNKISFNNNAITGSMSCIYRIRDDFKLNFISSTGFRNPNLDDYGKVREQEGYVIIPNDDITAEYSFNNELRIDKIIEGYIKLSGSLFHTLINNAIVRTDKGSFPIDTILFEGDYYPVAVNTNSDKAIIKGMSFEIISKIQSNLKFKSNFTYIVGKDISNDVPMPHIPPLFGRTSISYILNKFDLYGFLEYNGWKKAEDFSPYGEDKESEATTDGYPAWITANLGSNIYLTKNITCQVAIHNIFNSYYKPFASAVSGPGRNYILTLKASF